jgi:hypothetical protein
MWAKKLIGKGKKKIELQSWDVEHSKSTIDLIAHLFVFYSLSNSKHFFEL